MLRLSLVISLLAAFSPLHAQDNEAKGAVNAGVTTLNVFRGIERAEAGAQFSARMESAGFSASLTSTQAFRSGDPGETDLDAEYRAKVSDQLSVTGSLAGTFFNRLPAGATRYSTEAGIKAAWTLADGPVASLAWYHDFRLEADTLETTVGQDFALTHLGAFLTLRAFLGVREGRDLLPDAPGPKIHDSYVYAGAEALLPYRVGEHTLVTAGLHLSDAFGQDRAWSAINASGAVRAWVTLTVNYEF